MQISPEIKVRLTKDTPCAGCAAKLDLAALDDSLMDAPPEKAKLLLTEPGISLIGEILPADKTGVFIKVDYNEKL